MVASPRDMYRKGLEYRVRRGGVTITLSDGSMMRGMFQRRMEDPVTLAMEGVDNIATPNRYHVTAIDDDRRLVEGHDVSILGESYRIVDVDLVAFDEGLACVRATMLALGDRG